MFRNLCLVAAGLLLLASLGCDTKNVGGQLPRRGPQQISITVPTGMFTADNVNFSASWSGGISPYSISWDFGGGADPNRIGPLAASSPDVRTVNFNNNAGGTFTVTVTVTDAAGQSASANASYTYGTDGGWSMAVLSIVSGDGTNLITVHGYDSQGYDIEVYVTSPENLQPDAEHKTIAGGDGDVTFTFQAEDIFGGGGGTASFVGYNGINDSNIVTANVVVPGPILAADTLYAIPLRETAAAGEPVRIVVATGVPAHPFQFMNGCRVTAPTGFDYVSQSFNIGVPGGQTWDVDGFWTNMNPGGGFLLPPDIFFVGTDLGGGLIGFDFNVTPLAGSDRTSDSGALFNFEATFAAGVNRLGFQDVSGVSRTYYTDSTAAPDRFWSDISNSHAGIPNAVTVE